VIERLRRSSSLDLLVVATSKLAENDAIARECQSADVECFRGSEADVLDRYFLAAREYEADAIVRITADCPLIDPELVDDLVNTFLKEKADYASNVFPRTYPRGLDAEVIAQPALYRAWREASEPHQREHVTPYLYEHPEMFRLVSTRGEQDYGGHRWTFDTAEDLQLIRAIYERFAGREHFSWREIVDTLAGEPELVRINAHVRQRGIREGYENGEAPRAC